MEIIYYPNMYLTSELLLKQFFLCWGTVKTIVPPSEKAYFDAYLSGEIHHEVNFPIERYKAIYDVAGEKVIDFLVIGDDERVRASEQMLELLTTWNADTKFYDSLKIHSIDDLIGKKVEWYWFLHEKIESSLVDLMLQERLVVNWSPGEIVGFQEIGKSYMSVIAAELKRSRHLRLITDDEYYLAAKGPSTLVDSQPAESGSGYELISLAIPQVFFDSAVLDRLSWKDIFKIRTDLLPFAESFYREVEQYQENINSLAANGRDDDAFDTFCEFCERVADSFKPFAKEFGKALRTFDVETLGMINGIALPVVKLATGNPELARICDIAALASTIGKYAVSGIQRNVGFEYLENLGRELQIAKLKNTVTSLVPKGLKSRVVSR